MNDKKVIYTKPGIEVLEVELEGVIADSPGVYSLNEENTYGGEAFSKQRSFWED